MLPDIVSMKEVKAFLRVDQDHENDTIMLLINAATEAALRHVHNFNPDDDIPHGLKLAILVHVASAFRNREDAADAPPSAVRLLFPLRHLDV